MNIALRFVPFLVGVVVSYVVVTNIAHLDMTLKFIVVSICTLCLGYFFTWFNIRMMHRTGELSEGNILKPNHLGHIILFLGALVIGYGFSINGKILLLTGFAFLWFADDLLTKTSLATLNQGGQQNDSKQIGQHSAASDSLFNAIAEKRKTDPLIGAKLGGKEVFERLLAGMKNERGVHIESMLCALGALAGYSCQANLRAQAVAKGMDETTAFISVSGADGRKYFFGDPLNQALAESQHSIWNLAVGAARSNGCSILPDINDIFSHVTETVGTDSFGVPRFPDGHNASDSPINYLKVLWPTFFPLVTTFCKEPIEWPFLFGIAIQEALDAGKQALPQDVALQIIMEAAIPMSKVDLAPA